jgi:CHAT domain-containing protein/tetratricopeptide (TPR) repeat protein
MRFLLCILATLVLAAPTRHPSSPRYPAEATADSLYDIHAVDSLFAFSGRMIARARAAGDSVLLGRMTYHRGRARLALRDARAAGDLDRALAIATALDDSTGRMHALGLKAFVAVNQGQFELSIALNEERIALARALKRRGSEGWGHLLIGYAELYRENATRAVPEYEEAWRAFGDAGRPREQLTASIGLGRALDRLGRYDEARASYQRAWLTARELGDRSQEADAINNLGTIELEHGTLSLASDYFHRAYEIKRELKSFDIANVTRNVSIVDRMIGRYAHAESTLAEALALNNQGMLDAAMAIELGRLRNDQGRFAGGARCFRDVLDRGAAVPIKFRIEAVTHMAESLTGMDSIPAAVAAMDHEFPRLASERPSIWRADAYLAWSRALRADGQVTRARDAARVAWQDAVARQDSSLMVTGAAEVSLCERALGDDAFAYAWFQRAHGAFDASSNAGDFQWREARRAMLALALVESGDVLRAHPASEHSDVRARAHFDFLQNVYSRTLLERVTDPRRFNDIDPALARPVTSLEMQRDVLAPGECFFAVNAGKKAIYVFAMTREQFRSGVIQQPGPLTARFRAFARLNARPPADGVDLDGVTASLGHALLDDVDDLVRGSNTIYAAIDGSLAGAPFETLVCPGETGPLLLAHDVVRVPSAAFLRHLRARAAPAPASSTLLAIASGTPVLPGARREVDNLASRYGARRCVDPSRDVFLAGLADVDAVHVASHVHIDSERPWNSGIQIRAQARGPDAASNTGDDPLVFSSSDSSQIAAGLPVDPYVRASEIASHHVGARLVVLSACESALGRAAFAEGVLGIASSFVSAGSRTVVASLWPVDDRTTTHLMKGFYHELAAGKPVAAALRAAQLAEREKRPDPFYWAGFVVIGDGDVTLALSQSRARLPLIALLTGLTLVLSLPWVVWRRRVRRGRITP